MATDLEKKLGQVEKMITEKFDEIRQLKQLKKSYMIASKLEKKILGGGDGDGVVAPEKQG